MLQTQIFFPIPNLCCEVDGLVVIFLYNYLLVLFVSESTHILGRF